MNPSRPEDRLLIGEVAQLLGTTPKAIRHYEKLGLIDEPERSQSGYRLYTANDLLRLNRIKKLQNLGLSLQRIRNLLGDGSSGLQFEGVLQALLGEVESQIEHLERRRDELRRMLAEEVVSEEELSESDEEPHIFGALREHLGERYEDLDTRMLEQMKGLWNTLDSFQWPEGYKDFQEALARYMADHPDECERLLALEERLAALAHVPESSGEVEQLAEDYAAFFKESNFSEEVFGQTGEIEQPMGGMEAMLSGVVMNTMSPAQRRSMELLGERLGSGETPR